MSDTERGDLEGRSQRRIFSRGDVVFREGDVGDEVMVIREGRAKVCARRSGREIILSVVDPGSLLGEVSAIDGSPRSATVIALEPLEVEVVPVEAFSEFLQEHPRVQSELLRLLAARLRYASARQIEFGASTTLTRLCGTLAQLADRYGKQVGDRVEVETPLSQRELAEWSGMSREAFVKGLQQMRSLGWVVIEDHTIVLLDVAAVKRRAALR